MGVNVTTDMSAKIIKKANAAREFILESFGLFEHKITEAAMITRSKMTAKKGEVLRFLFLSSVDEDIFVFIFGLVCSMCIHKILF